MTYTASRRSARRAVGLALLASALVALPGPTANVSAQVRRDPVLRPAQNARQVQQILTRVRTEANALRTAVEETTPRGRATGNPRAAENQEVIYLVDDIVQATNELGARASRTAVSQNDLDEFLRQAADLDAAMSAGQFRPVARTAWTRLRGTIGELASAYAVDWDWTNPRYTSDGWNTGNRRFSGTYRLSPADSDDPRVVANNALRTVAAADRNRIARQLENRLTPPETISIDRDNTRVTVASSTGPQATFDADGRDRIETGAAGRSITTRATLNGDEVEVTTSGSGGSDFSVTFEPTEDGQELSVTRRLYNEALRAPVVVRSVYRRTSATANWNVYDGTGARPRPAATTNRGLAIPTGTMIVGTLEQPLNFRTAREGDEISLRVSEGPVELRNAVVQGFVTAEPTRASSRTGVSIAFDRIRLSNGRTADFSGTIDSVRDAQGRAIAIDQVESADRNNTDEAVQRGAIGAAVGAILGAVIGGGKGAAVGAVLGAGGGAGTVLLENQTQQSLPRGTEFTIRTDTFELP